MKKKIFTGLVLFASALGVAACNFGSSTETPSSSEELSSESSLEESSNRATYTTIKPISYEGVYTQTDMTVFYAETKQQNGSSWDNPRDYGFVPSVWHTLKINDVDVPVYSTRCGYGIHSFAYVDVDTDGDLDLEAEVTLWDLPSLKSAIILPEKRNQPVKISGKRYSFKITEYSDSTICFGRTKIDPEYALTIYVAPERKAEVPQGMERVDINPGTYDDNDTTVDIPSLRDLDPGKFYYFKKGHYYVNSILFPDNAVIYFEPGVYMEFRQDDDKSCFGNAGTKVTVLGRCLCDFSKLMGGDAKTKGAYNFSGLADSYLEGFLSINSNTWTMTYTNCDRVEICNNMLFGYRTYSDGIMLAGCTDSTVHHNFVRSGDDAIECKATSARVVEKNNLLYEYNTVWTDKANAYGAIYESNANITGVTFRHNSVGFAQSAWTDFLGCFIVYLGTDYNAKWSDIHFEDSEVYSCNNTLMNITLTTVNPYYYGDQAATNYGGTIANIYWKNITLARHEKTNVDIHSLRIAAILNENNPNAIEHMNLGKFYVDNVNYLGTVLTKENHAENKSLISTPEDLGWRQSNIKWNTLTETAE